MEKQIKLLCSDLDGTLFYPKRRFSLVSRKNKKFILDFLRKGNEVVLVTGRSPDFVQKLFKVFGRPLDVIGMAGAYSIRDGEIVDEHFLDFDIKSMLVDLHEHYAYRGIIINTKSYPMLVGTTKMNWSKQAFYRLYYFTLGRYAEDYSFSNQLISEQLDNKDIYKLNIIFGISKKSAKKANEAAEYLKKRYGDKAEINPTRTVIEITASGKNKAEGILTYIKAKNISKDNVYVVGDSGNDISMFKAYHENSFCLGHAPQNVKRYAKTIIRRFNHLDRYI